MHTRLIALAAAALLFIMLPIQASLASTDSINQKGTPVELDLPSVLTEDDSFNDLPFEQLRQALREEVETGPSKGLSPRSFKRYNLLIR